MAQTTLQQSLPLPAQLHPPSRAQGLEGAGCLVLQKVPAIAMADLFPAGPSTAGELEGVRSELGFNPHQP